MATTKATKPVSVASTVKKADEVKEAPKTKPEVKQPEPEVKAPPVPAKKVLPKLEDSVRVRVRSNRYGTLVFINRHTGDRYTWSSIDEEQDIMVGDIRSMRTTSSIFFTDAWVIVESIEDERCQDLTDKEIYEVLGLSRYYNKQQRSHYLSTAREWTPAQIRERVPKLSENVKSNLLVAINSAVKDGLLTDLRLVKAWEKALGTTLDVTEAPEAE